MVSRGRLASLMLAWGMAVSPPGAAQPAQQNVPGELIVKYAADSGTGRLVERLLREDAGGRQALDPALESLADRVDLPLELERITSGAELLLRLDGEELLRRLEASVAARPEVRAVELIRGEPGRSPLQPGVHLLLKFADDSRTAAMLAESPGEDAVESLVASLTGDGEVPVVGKRVSERSLALYPNHPALLALFEQRLQALPEIEYVQVNTVMGFRR